MAKHMLRVLDRKLHHENMIFVSLKCENCPKNVVLSRKRVYEILVEGSRLLVHTTPEGRKAAKEWLKCPGK